MYKKVSTLEDLKTLDNELVVEGYRWGLSNPGALYGCSRAFWHGWRNAQMDKGRIPPDAESNSLAKQLIVDTTRNLT